MRADRYDYNGERYGTAPTRCERLTGFDHRFLIVFAVLILTGWTLFFHFCTGG